MSGARKINNSITRVQANDEVVKLAKAPSWNRRILIVDDEPELVKIYVETLAAKNLEAVVRSSRLQSVTNAEVVPDPKFVFEVATATNAAEAMVEVKKMASQGLSFAMGFFDVRLGAGPDGVELVREIFSSMPQMFAVFVTAYNDRSINSISSTLGVAQTAQWDYMNKPFNASEITQKARNFVALYNLKQESERNELVRSDLQRQVLESSRLSSVAAVARGVAHEFGNLLMQILGKAEISRKKSEPEMREAFDRIIDASQRAHEILDRFNSLSDTKSVSTQKAWCQVEMVVDEAIDLLSHQFKKTNTRVSVLRRDNVKAFVHSTSILQVLVNLFINALHAMGSDGQIDISLKGGEGFFDLELRDYGPGVPADIIDKILEPFFTTKGEQGTGLGLAICREIVEIDHAGDFKIFNHPTKGLCIHIHIPFLQEVIR